VRPGTGQVKEIVMDFAALLISNALVAVVIYFVITWIWQE
jgi:hypothetical protein